MLREISIFVKLMQCEFMLCLAVIMQFKTLHFWQTKFLFFHIDNFRSNQTKYVKCYLDCVEQEKNLKVKFWKLQICAAQMFDWLISLHFISLKIRVNVVDIAISMIHTFTCLSRRRLRINQTDSIRWTIAIIDIANAEVDWTLISDGCHSIHLVTAEKRSLNSSIANTIDADWFNLLCGPVRPVELLVSDCKTEWIRQLVSDDSALLGVSVDTWTKGAFIRSLETAIKSIFALTFDFLISHTSISKTDFTGVQWDGKGVR